MRGDLNVCCQTLLCRHKYLTAGLPGRHNWRKVHHLADEIAELNQQMLENQTLAVDTAGKFFVEKGMRFQGAHYMLDIDIVSKLSKGDVSILSSTEIPDTTHQAQSQYVRKAQDLHKNQKKRKLPVEVLEVADDDIVVDEQPSSSIDDGNSNDNVPSLSRNDDDNSDHNDEDLPSLLRKKTKPSKGELSSSDSESD